MYEAMESMYAERIAALDVDTFIIVDTHWFSTIDYILNANERLSGSYTSEGCPDMIHDYEYDYRGDPELADWIAEVGAKNNVHVNACHYKTLPIHYPSLTTMRYLNPQGTARVLSVSVCQSAELHNDLAFGRAVGEAVATCPASVRCCSSPPRDAHKFNAYDVYCRRRAPTPTTSRAENAHGTNVFSTECSRGDADVLSLSAEFKRSASPEGRWAHYLNLAAASAASPSPPAARCSGPTKPRSGPDRRTSGSTSSSSRPCSRRERRARVCGIDRRG